MNAICWRGIFRDISPLFYHLLSNPNPQSPPAQPANMWWLARTIQRKQPSQNPSMVKLACSTIVVENGAPF